MVFHLCFYPELASAYEIRMDTVEDNVKLTPSNIPSTYVILSFTSSSTMTDLTKPSGTSVSYTYTPTAAFTKDLNHFVSIVARDDKGQLRYSKYV